MQGGMHFVGFAQMAAAVSNAGGLGIITSHTLQTPERLEMEIALCRSMTDEPFGVNLTFLPSVRPPDYPGIFARSLRVVYGSSRRQETIRSSICQCCRKPASRSYINAPPSGTR
jgi:NAD(P)H-dependent flavin oxidoreductase YrpB (nitropropane dioxygenase family)